MGFPMTGGGVGWPTYHVKLVDTAGVYSYAIKKADGVTAATAYTDALITWTNITTADLEEQENGTLKLTPNHHHAGSKYHGFRKKWAKPSKAGGTAKEFTRLDGVKVSSSNSSSSDFLLTLAAGDLDEDDQTKRELVPILHTVSPASKDTWDPENPRKPGTEFISVSELLANLVIPAELLPPALFDTAGADVTLAKLDENGKPNYGYDRFWYTKAA